MVNVIFLVVHKNEQKNELYNKNIYIVKYFFKLNHKPHTKVFRLNNNVYRLNAKDICKLNIKVSSLTLNHLN